MIDILAPLKNMFPDMVSVRRSLGSNFTGSAEQWGPSSEYRAFVVGQHTMVRAATGKDVVSKVHIVFHGHNGFTLDDEYTLPVEFGTQKPRAIAIQEATHEGGRHHQTVFF